MGGGWENVGLMLMLMDGFNCLAEGSEMDVDVDVQSFLLRSAFCFTHHIRPISSQIGGRATFHCPPASAWIKLCFAHVRA